MLQQLHHAELKTHPHTHTQHTHTFPCPNPQVGTVQQERAGTEGIVAELGARCKALEKWLEANEWKAAALSGGGGGKGKGGKGGGGVDADAAAEMLAKLDVNKLVVPADDLCRQALGTQVRVV